MSTQRNIIQESKGIINLPRIDDLHLYQLYQTWKTITLFFLFFQCVCVNMCIYTFVSMHVKIRIQHQVSSLISLHRLSSKPKVHWLPSLARGCALGIHLFVSSSQALELETSSTVPRLFPGCWGMQSQDFCHVYQLNHLPLGL